VGHVSVPVSSQQELLNTLLASSGDCIKILDLDGNLIFMTEGGQRVMEVPDFGAIRGCPWPDFWKDAGNAEAKAAIAAAKDGKVGHFVGFATTMAGTPKWWEVTVTLIRDAGGRPDRLLSVSRDITEAHNAGQALRQSEALFKTFAQAMPNQVWSATPDGQLDWFNDQVFSYSGMRLEELVGGKWAVMVHQDDIAAATRNWAEALTSGKPYQTEFRLRSKDGSFNWHLARALPIRNAAGEISRWIGTNTDISKLKQAEDHQQLLAYELQHRMANTMAMVSAIAGQTFRTTATKEEAQNALQARLRALSQAHAVLVQSSWKSAPMETVVEGALAPYRSGEGRITISGPAVDLPARRSLSLALALHELATNATKYGALSVPDGKLDVTWSITPGDEGALLDFCWREFGGPEVSPPTRRGFGSQLIETTLQADFGESASIDYAPAGLVCRFSAPLAGFEEKAEPRAVR
jgi:PAS domain S-box-containing protein